MLKQDIQNAVNQALKAGDQMSSETLRMLLASVTSKEKDKRYKISKDKPESKEEDLIKESKLSDEQIVEVVSSEIKKRKDAIALYNQGNRPELAEKEKKEIEILQKYLPEQLSQDEVKKLIEEAIAKTGAKEMKDMGKVMADLSPKIKGKADSGEVSKIIKDLLSK
jgi:hypothetical protein